MSNVIDLSKFQDRSTSIRLYVLRLGIPLLHHNTHRNAKILDFPTRSRLVMDDFSSGDIPLTREDLLSIGRYVPERTW